MHNKTHHHIKPRWLFFWLFTFFASQGRFSSLFLQDCGLTEGQIGILLSLKSVIGLIINPLIANAADLSVKRGLVYGRELYVALLSILTTLSFLLHGLNHIIQHEFVSSFTYFLIVRTLYAACMSPIYPIISGIALQYLADAGEDKQAFGGERVYGAMSWAIVSFIMGIAIDSYTTSVMYLFVLVTLLPVLYCIYRIAIVKTSSLSALVEKDNIEISTVDCEPANQCSRSTPTIVPEETHKPTALTVLFYLFSTPHGAIFTFLCIILSIGTSIVENLVFLFFTDVLGSSNFICGLSVVVTVIFEIPIFQNAQKLLRQCGRESLLVISCVSYTIRVVGYTLVPDGWWVLLLEPLHGVTYGCSATASVDYAASVAPPGLEATAQAVMGALQGGVGVFVGTGVGGFIEQKYGSDVLYRGAASAVGGTAILFVTVLFAWHRMRIN